LPKAGPEKKLWVILTSKTTLGGTNLARRTFLPHPASSSSSCEPAQGEGQPDRSSCYLANRTFSMAEVEHVCWRPRTIKIRPGHAFGRMDWTGCFGAGVGKEESIASRRVRSEKRDLKSRNSEKATTEEGVAAFSFGVAAFSFGVAAFSFGVTAFLGRWVVSAR
jgi:hypothetical protein